MVAHLQSLTIIFTWRVGLYDQIAQIYDLIHVSVKGDIPFILKEAERTGGPILEYGSGTGRLLIPMARQGYKTTGVENSAAMLEQAQRNLAREAKHVQTLISFVKEDIGSFKSEDQFALAVIGFNTLMHFAPDQVRQLLLILSESLMPDGRLIIDLANPYDLFDLNEDNPKTERVIRDETGTITLRLVYSSFPGAEQMTRRIIWEAVTEQPKDRISPPRYEAELRYYYPHEVDLLLARGGFRTAAIYGDYSREPFQENSPRLIFVAEKAI